MRVIAEGHRQRQRAERRAGARENLVLRPREGPGPGGRRDQAPGPVRPGRRDGENHRPIRHHRAEHRNTNHTQL